ncbi:putative cytochrome P450 [Helianthus anomalus]
MLYIQDMFIAVTDTSSVIIGWTMFELIINPRLMHNVQGVIRRVLKGKKKVFKSDTKDLHYLTPVINETLRLHPPTPLIPRE